MLFKRLLWVLPFASFALGYFFLTFFCTQRIILMPSLIGKTVHDVVLILSENQLNMRIINQKSSSEVLPGTILSQSPAPYEKIKAHQSVFVVLSKYPPVAMVPDLRTQLLDAANNMATSLGVRTICYRLSSLYPTNQCIGQMPSAHEQMDGNTIMLYVSDGISRPIIWPDFKNKLIGDVLEFFRSHEIESEVLHSNYIDNAHSCQNCIIVDQRPLAGSLIKNDSNKKIRAQFLVK